MTDGTRDRHPSPGDRLRLGPAAAEDQAFGAVEWALLLAAAALWGSSFLLIDIGLDALHPGVISMARVGLGAMALVLIPAARRPIDRSDRGTVLVLGLSGMGIPLLLFPLAQQWIDSSLAGMINGSVPLMAAAWAVVLTGSLPSARHRWGLLVGFAGVVAVSSPGLVTSSAGAPGIILALVAVALYGLAANLAAPLQRRYGALPVILHMQGVALVCTAPFGLAGIRQSVWELPSVLAMLPLGVLGTGLAYVLMVTLVGRVGAPRGSIAIYLTPVVAIILGVVVRGETVRGLAMVGTGLVLAGAWQTSRRARSGPHAHPEAAPDLPT